MEYTPEVKQKLEHYLTNHDLPAGLGSEDSACSVAAINLALTGELTDEIPPCMSKVLGCATILLQDAMPHDMRNSRRYKEWLPKAAGTGRDHEQERLEILLEWMWSVVLPKLQPVADLNGFGAEWAAMCRERTSCAASAAADTATDAAYAAYASDAASRAAAHAAYAADADTASYAYADAADAAADAATNAAAYADAVNSSTFWQDVDPIGVLERMTYLDTHKKSKD